MSLLSDAVSRLLFIPTLLVAAAFLVRAPSAPGDGFTAGLIAVIAYLVIATGTIERAPAVGRGPSLERPAALGAAGMVVMLAVAVAPVLLGHPPLTQLPTEEPPALGALALDTALLFDAGIALVVMGLAAVAIQRLDPELAPEER